MSARGSSKRSFASAKSTLDSLGSWLLPKQAWEYGSHGGNSAKVCQRFPPVPYELGDRDQATRE
jgi:hypothetical protein